MRDCSTGDTDVTLSALGSVNCTSSSRVSSSKFKFWNIVYTKSYYILGDQ